MTPGLRPVTAADEPLLARLFAATRTRELAALPDPAQAGALIALQLAGQRDSWRATYPGYVDQVITVGGAPVGRFVTHMGATELRLIEITLLPERQGRGLGSALIRELQRSAAVAGLPLPLRLRAERGSAALALYRRLGFVEEASDDPLRAVLCWRAS